MATFEKTDDSVVVIIGSGAGGGALANELAQKGIKSVVLEAGKRFEMSDIENDEWAMFNKISWLDKRYSAGGWHGAVNHPNLPALDRQRLWRIDSALGRGITPVQGL